MAAVLNLLMHDGSRQFGELPQRVGWYAVRDHVLRLPGASLTGFLCDGVTEAWIDFAFAGHAFTINDQFGEYWFRRQPRVSRAAPPNCSLALRTAHRLALLGHFMVARAASPASRSADRA
jgi:hypothetical protein